MPTSSSFDHRHRRLRTSYSSSRSPLPSSSTARRKRSPSPDARRERSYKGHRTTRSPSRERNVAERAERRRRSRSDSGGGTGGSSPRQSAQGSYIATSKSFHRSDRDSVKRRRISPSRSRSSPRKRDRLRSSSPPRSRDRLPRSPSPYRRRQDRLDSRSVSPPSRRRRRDSSNDARSPPPRRRRRSPSYGRRSLTPPPRKRSRSPAPRSRKPLPSQEVSFRGEQPGKDGTVAPPIEKEKPNFGNTGLLAKEANTVAAGNTKIVLKYNEPPEARKPPPSQAWRLFVFKGTETLKTIQLYTESVWLIGREASVADILVEHPSCSKQHAVIQFRHSVKVNEYGDRKSTVRPYLIDLDSANGTSLNGETITGSRYVEVKDGDVVKFGLSEREYVFMLPPQD